MLASFGAQHGSKSARIAGRGAALLIAGAAAASVGACGDGHGGNSQGPASDSSAKIVRP
jgi:hypothetical protein